MVPCGRKRLSALGLPANREGAVRIPAWPHSVALRKLLTISGPLRSLSSWHSSMNVLEGKGMAVGHTTASVQRPGRGRAAGVKGRWQGGVVTPQPAEVNPDYPAQRGRKGPRTTGRLPGPALIRELSPFPLPATTWHHGLWRWVNSLLGAKNGMRGGDICPGKNDPFLSPSGGSQAQCVRAWVPG